VQDFLPVIHHNPDVKVADDLPAPVLPMRLSRCTIIRRMTYSCDVNVRYQVAVAATGI